MSVHAEDIWSIQWVGVVVGVVGKVHSIPNLKA